MFKFNSADYPNLPGIYLMKNSEDQVIYVGKAKSLRDRLGQYFSGNRSLKTSILSTHVAKIEVLLTKNEREALILESNFIKSYQPKYNMMLKDARHYSYLAITDEEYPKLLVARKNSSGKFRIKAKEYFGPFVEEGKRAISVRFLRNMFKVRICNKMPKKECLAYHLGNCQAPCIGKVSKEEYNQNIENLSKVLRGKGEVEEVRKKLEDKMREYSLKEDYENAKNTREQINSLDIFFNKQKIERPQNHRDEDYIWIEKTQSEIFFQIIKSRNGVLSKSEKHAIKINDQERAESLFLYNYYEVDQETIIYSNLDSNEREFLNKIFESDKFREIPKSKEKIIEIARNSLNQNEIEISVSKLREELKLEKDPIVIETFDISTLFGENNVASMVQFVNGRSNKKEYRKFMIKSIEKQDDFASMKEVVYRRYSRLVAENKPFPDLIVIDGGIGQLHAAIEGLKEANVNIAICSLAKQFEEVFMPGKMNSIKMDKKNPALKLLQMGRDEAHRFALTFQRLRRKKKMIEKD